MVDVSERMREVVSGAIWQSTVYAAFQRAEVYKKSATPKQRATVREALKDAVLSISEHYKNEVSEEDHIKNLLSVRTRVNQTCSSYLLNNSFSLGVAQKALNLHLKQLWCQGIIKRPPHCPLDRIIISHLKVKDRENWTQMRSISTYKSLIKKLSVLAENEDMPLAEWELVTYEK